MSNEDKDQGQNQQQNPTGQQKKTQRIGEVDGVQHHGHVVEAWSNGRQGQGLPIAAQQAMGMC